jgi:hypothetical protein
MSLAERQPMIISVWTMVALGCAATLAVLWK